jgi:transposase
MDRQDGAYRARRLGRTPIKSELEERIRDALVGGLSIRKAATKFSVNKSTVQRIGSPFGEAASGRRIGRK